MMVGSLPNRMCKGLRDTCNVSRTKKMNPHNRKALNINNDQKVPRSSPLHVLDLYSLPYK
jgi:hypothetical protein